MARFSGATVLLILVATVSVYTCALLAGAALGRTVDSSTATTEQPTTRDIALRVSVSFRGLAEDLAKELWGGYHREEGRSGGRAHAGAGDRAAAAALPASAAHDVHEGAAAARPLSSHSNFSREITEGTGPGGGVVKVGPWGGSEGQAFYMRRHGAASTSTPRLLGVTLYHADAVYAFGFEYLLAGARRTDYHGSMKGLSPSLKPSKVNFSPDEHLTAVEGTFGRCRRVPQVVVTSLTFRTDKGRTYGPYGEKTGTPFSIPAANGCIVGFWGRSGWLLDAIGVYIMPCQVNEATS